MPHVIRLRGPWEYEPLARFATLSDGRVDVKNDGLPPSGIIELPADWGKVLGAEFQGRVRFTRRFRCPTGLSPTLHVWLIIDDVDWQAEVTLNESLLGKVAHSDSPEPSQELQCPARFDITTLLSPQNKLSIVITCPGLDAENVPLQRRARSGQPGGRVGLVRLEID